MFYRFSEKDETELVRKYSDSTLEEFIKQYMKRFHYKPITLYDYQNEKQKRVINKLRKQPRVFGFIIFEE